MTVIAVLPLLSEAVARPFGNVQLTRCLGENHPVLLAPQGRLDLGLTAEFPACILKRAWPILRSFDFWRVHEVGHPGVPALKAFTVEGL